MTAFENSDHGHRLVADLVAGFDAAPPPGRDVFTIRDLAREFAVSARTLRFYEEKGLLDPTRRGEQRLYTRRDRARLAYVIAGKTVGFSLEEVREMLDLYDLGDGQVTQLKVAVGKFAERIERLEQQKNDIDRVVAELTRARDAMKAKLAARGASLDHPPLKGEGRIGEANSGRGPERSKDSDPHPASFARRPPPSRGR